MKKLILILLLLTGCGKDSYYHTKEYVPVVDAQDFEGYWYCDNNSNLELIADFKNRITFETIGQSLNTVNPSNDTLGTFPVISERDVLVNNNKLLINPRNYTFDKDTHDVEKDTGGDIDGQKRVDLLIELKSKKKLNIKVKVYNDKINNNINSIVADREFNCSL